MTTIASDARDIATCRFAVLMLCADCGKEINRTTELDGPKLWGEWTSIAIGAAFGGRCGDGCRSTLSDVNLNTTLPILDLDSGKRIGIRTLKLLHGRFVSDEYDICCVCASVAPDEVYRSATYPAVHGPCGRWVEPYRRSI